MGLGSWLAPRQHLSAAATQPRPGGGGAWAWTDWQDLLEQSRHGAPITRQRAMGLPGVGRGVRLNADVLASLTPYAVRNADDPHKPIELLESPPLFVDPDPSWHGRSVWLAAAFRDLQWDGNAFADKTVEVDRLGYPVSLHLIASRCVTWDRPSVPRPGGPQKVYIVNDPATGARSEVEPADMFHAAVDVDSGQRMGQGILQTQQDTLRLIAAVERATYVVMRDGKPVGILTSQVDATNDELKDLKANFMAGVRADGIAALNRAGFGQVSWSAKDLTLIEAREHNLRLAADVVGLSPYLLGVPSESRIYTNTESEWHNYIRTGAGRYLGPMQDALTRCIPRGQVNRFNTDELERPDAKTRWDIHKIALEMGATTIPEIRQEERMGPMPEEEGAA